MEDGMLRGRLERASAVSCIALMLAGCMARGGSTMNETRNSGSAPFTANATTAVVRYHIRDIDRAIAFYTERLGFHLEQRAGSVFATVSRGDLHLLLSGPGSSGSRPMPDGRKQEPGGFNRIVLYVDSLDAMMSALKTGGAKFRNDVEVGPGGKQIQVEDPDGNPIEIHEAPKKESQ
jgi:catechol 2,3-dioxygenase-like lactoylglutathione lyase family enzyme